MSALEIVIAAVVLIGLTGWWYPPVGVAKWVAENRSRRQNAKTPDLQDKSGVSGDGGN